LSDVTASLAANPILAKKWINMSHWISGCQEW
jgi:hypothetical protein